jgi:hypothetical protein
MTYSIKKISNSTPTPERRAKALGYDVIGRRPGRKPKLMMTLDWLDYHGHFKHDQHSLETFRYFCGKVLEANGINATDDYGHSTSHMISSYGDSTLVAHGPRDGPSDRAIEARALVEFVKARIPEDCTKLFNQLMVEETSESPERPKSLAPYGNQLGWQQDKQASASGQTQAIMICRIVHAAIKRFQSDRMWRERALLKRQNGSVHAK